MNAGSEAMKGSRVRVITAARMDLEFLTMKTFEDSGEDENGSEEYEVSV